MSLLRAILGRLRQSGTIKHRIVTFYKDEVMTSPKSTKHYVDFKGRHETTQDVMSHTNFVCVRFDIK